ncbi:MAG: hypothetical protein IKP37_04640 [Paludibacteraceae bacterium]|nr:hypothetical protein [Paludibacteraceae bacterium]
MGLYLNPNADAPDGCAGPVYAFRLTNLEPGIGYRVRVSNVTGGGDYRTRCRSKADSAFYTSELDGLLEEGLGITGTGLFKEETDDMRYLQSLYRQERGDSIDNTAAYIFILPKASVDGVKGDMPLTRPVGYVFASGDTYADGQTIAHELGHGLYSFQHAFDYMGVSQGETDNLMDYGLPQGEHLAVWQWNLISTHKNYTVPFLTDDEDGWIKDKNKFDIEITETKDYKNNPFFSFDNCYKYKSVYAPMKKTKGMYFQYPENGKKKHYVPILLVPQGSDASFSLKFFNIPDSIKNKGDYQLSIEASNKEDIDFERTSFTLKEIKSDSTIDIHFKTSMSLNMNLKFSGAYEIDSINKGDNRFICIKNQGGEVLAKAQYITTATINMKYKLVYIVNKDNSKADFNEKEFEQKLNQYHGHLFVNWTPVESESFKLESIPNDIKEKGKSEGYLYYVGSMYLRNIDAKWDSIYKECIQKSKKKSAVEKRKEAEIEVLNQYKKYCKSNKLDTKLYFISDYECNQIGGATLKYYQMGINFKNEFPEWVEVPIHEFGHFLYLPDAVLILDLGKNNEDHVLRNFYLGDLQDCDNFMYYLTMEQMKIIRRKRWFMFQVKYIHNSKDLFKFEKKK